MMETKEIIEKIGNTGMTILKILTVNMIRKIRMYGRHFWKKFSDRINVNRFWIWEPVPDFWPI